MLIRLYEEEMYMKTQRIIRTKALTVFVLSVLLSACGAFGTEAPTATPQPTATKTVTPTATFTATATLTPTRIPNLTATQYSAELNAEVQKYFDLGYLPTTEGKFKGYSSFSYKWAQLGWYRQWDLFSSPKVKDFLLSAHLKWSSAYHNADVSGCGFYFAYQEDTESHYAVFLDRTRVFFVTTEYYYEPMTPTHGSGLVKFGNPADKPVEADLTLIVIGTRADVFVDGEFVAEYTLSERKAVSGYIGTALLSGTNKDFGTSCDMRNIHTFVPNE